MKVQRTIEVLAPPETVFEILGDLRARAKFMADLETWEHLSGPMTGEGGQYRLRQRIGPASVISYVQIVDWKPPHLFGWTAIRGLRTWGRFTVKATDTGSLVTLRLSYASGDNLLSFVVDRVAGPLFIRPQADRTLKALADQVVDRLTKKVRRSAKIAIEADTQSKATTPKKKKKAEPAPVATLTGRTATGTRSRRPKGLPRESRTPQKRSTQR
ncbi:MAG: SRPBCC family protein [Actinobacteria bacterium]|nr:SRPBCC family protein [Actinomycetota bacterium]